MLNSEGFIRPTDSKHRGFSAVHEEAVGKVHVIHSSRHRTTSSLWLMQKAERHGSVLSLTSISSDNPSAGPLAHTSLHRQLVIINIH